MSKEEITFEYNVPGELHANGKIWRVSLNLILIARGAQPASSLAAHASPITAPDGTYELRYIFNGTEQVQRVQLSRGELLMEL